MRVALVIEYDGTNYCGWQTQKNGISIQETIEKAYLEATGENIKLVASGRTDSGVHAKGQVAHFDTKLNRPAESFKHVLNSVLPKDIFIVDSFMVKDDFNARCSAKRKTYQYRCYVDKNERPLRRRYAVNVEKGFSLELMQRGALVLIGEHDYKCFLASGSSVKTTVRTIYSLDVSLQGDEVIFTVCGNGFLYNMVRSIVGTLFKVGYGKMTVDELKNALETGNRKMIGKTMPPNGLTLLSVEYEN